MGTKKKACYYLALYLLYCILGFKLGKYFNEQIHKRIIIDSHVFNSSLNITTSMLLEGTRVADPWGGNIGQYAIIEHCLGWRDWMSSNISFVNCCLHQSRIFLLLLCVYLCGEGGWRVTHSSVPMGRWRGPQSAIITVAVIYLLTLFSKPWGMRTHRQSKQDVFAFPRIGKSLWLGNTPNHTID